MVEMSLELPSLRRVAACLVVFTMVLGMLAGCVGSGLCCSGVDAVGPDSNDGPDPGGVKRFRFFNTSKKKTLGGFLKVSESLAANGSSPKVAIDHPDDVDPLKVVNVLNSGSVGATKWVRVNVTLEGNIPLQVTTTLPAGGLFITDIWAHVDMDTANPLKYRLSVTGLYYDGSGKIQVLDPKSYEQP